MAAEEDKQEEWLEDEAVFKRNAFILIMEMVEMDAKTREDTSVLVDEIFHSIFFLGYISFPKISIRNLLGDDDELYQCFEERYPRPFIYFSSQLPQRSPFSCVLDMIVHLKGQDNEQQIRDELKALYCKLMDKAKSKILISTTVCISRTLSRTQSSVRYYGVSMSTFGRLAGKIMLAASCLSGIWDDNVADAVMTYCHSKEKQPNFDGTFQLPQNVTCRAFNISDGSEKKPCRSCKNLFGLPTESTDEWAYGNCAEVESVSKLLKSEKRDLVQLNQRFWTEEERYEVKDRFLKGPKSYLKSVGFKWDNTFYTPQRCQILQEVNW